MAQNSAVVSSVSGIKKGDLFVYVFNAIEDEWSFIDSVSDPVKKVGLMANQEDAADCYYLSICAESQNVFISPKPIADDFQRYAQNLFNTKLIEVITPKIRSHLICEDLLNDAATFSSFVDKAEPYARIILTAYSASAQFYLLVQKLRELGLTVITPEAPEPDCAWTVNFYGSKSGIRQLAQKSAVSEPDFIMPEGLICSGKYDAVKIAANKYLKQKGVVIKTNKGSGGDGVLIFRDGELPSDYNQCEKEILKAMNSDKYWDIYPIVVEDLIPAATKVGVVFPNLEYKIHKNGRVELLYLSLMKVTDKGRYYGLDINDDIFKRRLTARMVDMGYYIAEKYAAAGYRGHFDIDMMVAKNGKLYVNESNTRNTAGTDVYKVCRKLLGNDFTDDAYVISRSGFYFTKSHAKSFHEVVQTLSPVLFSPTTREGLIINSELSVQGRVLLYTIVAKNQKRAYQFEEKMKQLILEGN